MTATFLRQLTTLLTKNKRLLVSHPLHLLNLLLNSIPAVILAYAAGRDERGPSGPFPPMTSCGMVEPSYFLSIEKEEGYYHATQSIPITMNEVWRDGLPIWILSLGAVFSGMSVFLIVRSELASKRWGALRSAGLRDSVYWISWLLTFAVCGIVNSLLGGIVAAFLPVHVFQHVSFGVLFGLLLFLNLAIVTASLVLAAACGTIQSTTLTVVMVMGIICAGAAPSIAVSVNRGYIDADDAISTYYSYGGGGAFWAFSSTERTEVQYLNYTYNFTNNEYDSGEPTVNQCEMPLLSFEQGRSMKTEEERDAVPLEDVFTGCFVIPGASTMFLQDMGLYFFWYLLPQTHFTMAWSNILGFTGLPGNTFSLNEATKSSESLANEALSNYLASQGLPRSDTETNEPSLFPEGSTALPKEYYYYNYNYDYGGPVLNNCPSTEVIENLCRDYNQTSADCYYVDTHYPSSSPSVNDSIGYLLSLVVIYFVMAFYIGAVFPMSNGAALKFYFPLQPGFWLRGRSVDFDENDNSDDVETGIAPNTESRNVSEVGVEAVDVFKSYGKVEALKPFSIKLNVGEVTSLLGHNGAGKSTFVNMLCCEQNPSGGDIKVFGNSVKSNPHYVRSLLGECYQDDYLYPELSAQDHLELFAGIRGLASDKMESDVQLWLQSVDLELVKDNATSTFSGGMKRRLSVALSTIGPSKLIVLDEPTTGMDPISRRFVWDHITTIKPGRVILLTTHAMEEADLLSDEVAIVCDGKLVASGSPLELKHQHGSAVQLSIIAGKEHAEEVNARIVDHFSNAKEWIDTTSSDSGYITLSVKKVKRNDDDEGVEPSSLASFIGWIEEEDSPVQEFSLSNSSLEEVFLAVTKHHQPVDKSSQQEEMISKGCCCCCQRKPPTVAEEVNTADLTSTKDIHLENQPKTTLSDFSRNLSVKSQTIALVRFYLKRNWSGRPSKVNWIVYGILCLGNICLGLGLAAMWPDEVMYFFLLLTVFFISMIMISIISPVYGDRISGLQKMMEMQSLFKSSFLLGTSIYSWIVSFIYTFVVLTLFFATPIYRNAITPDCSSNDNFDDDYYGYGSYDYSCGYGSFGSKPVVHPGYRNPVMIGQYDGEDVTIYAHQKAGGYGMMFGIILVFSLTFPGAVLSSSFFPGYKIPLIGVSMLLLVACVSPFILYAAKTSDPYFFGNCTETIQNAVNCSEYSFDLENANSTFVECVGFDVSNPMIACLPTEASILPQIGLFYALSLGLMSSVVFESEPAEYAAEVFVPNLEASCTGNTCSFMYARNLFRTSLGYMFLGAVLLLVLGIAISYIANYPISILIRLRHKLHDWFKQETLEKTEPSLSEEKEMEEVSLERVCVESFLTPILETRNDSDPNGGALMLSHSVPREAKDKLPPVLTNKLRKVYTTTKKSPPKVALDSLDLHVPYGEVLGLLGKNGAGKTTALKILAGMDNATSGIGLVAGYDVEEERIAVYERLGNCPQFDTVWRAQSVKSHLEFYARLKGVNEPDKAALEIATAVGLGEPDVYIRPSGQLSGGMRRRLSIAISLVGSPRVVNLDEPTTGLDPSTRHEIWSLISSFASPERAVIITTHQMIEADTLCSRIAIISKGRLKVIGTQQHLKDNYGSGYLLQLNLLHNNAESVECALNFVKEHVHEEAKIVVRQAKTIGINLPREISIQTIFTKMYSEDASEVGINQFLVSQSSLEDVFVALG